MSVKQLMFFLGCAIAWFVLLPLCIVGGLLALISCAIVSEVGELVVGDAEKSIDQATARELARRVCLGD